MEYSFFSHDIIGGQMGRVGVLVGASVLWVCLCDRQTDRQTKLVNVCCFTKYKLRRELFLVYW